MDPGDLIFYGIIVVSVVSSIIKATKKKAVDGAETGMPPFRGNTAGDLFRTILEDIKEKEDDYIPASPQRVASNTTTQASKMKVEPLKRSSLASTYEQRRNATENLPRRESFRKNAVIETEVQSENSSDPILQTLDLKQMDELKKAIIYSEIIRPKF